MYRRITMTAIMLTLLGGLALLGGRARQTHAMPAGTLGTRFPLYVAASNTIITVDSTGVQRPVTAGDLLDRPQGLAFDSSGTLYVASQFNDRVVTVNSTGTQHLVTAGGNLDAPAALAFSPGYAFSGFFPPVESPPTVNVAQASRAIPVTFSLGGEQGLGIFAAGSPASQQITCDTSAPLSALEETVTAGGSSLTYDPTTAQYTYVWKTAAAWKRTCRTLTVTFNDGATSRATFQFR